MSIFRGTFTATREPEFEPAYGSPAPDPAKSWRATPSTDAIREAIAMLDGERQLAQAKGKDSRAHRLGMVMDLLREDFA